jgi:hypothetical protein
MAANDFFHSGWNSKNSAEFLGKLFESAYGEVAIGIPETLVYLKSTEG